MHIRQPSSVHSLCLFSSPPTWEYLHCGMLLQSFHLLYLQKPSAYSCPFCSCYTQILLCLWYMYILCGIYPWYKQMPSHTVFCFIALPIPIKVTLWGHCIPTTLFYNRYFEYCVYHVCMLHVLMCVQYEFTRLSSPPFPSAPSLFLSFYPAGPKQMGPPFELRFCSRFLPVKKESP